MGGLYASFLLAMLTLRLQRTLRSWSYLQAVPHSRWGGGRVASTTRLSREEQHGAGGACHRGRSPDTSHEAAAGQGRQQTLGWRGR